MEAVIINGKELASKQERELTARVSAWKRKTGITPKLVDIIIGSDSASVLYAKMKKKAALRVGIDLEILEFLQTEKPETIISKIKELNFDPKTHGIMVQLPIKIQNLNSKFKNIQAEIVNEIDPKKDVDCLTMENLELVRLGKPRYLPATVKGIIFIIENCKPVCRQAGLKIENSNICVVGASGMVGKPLADYLEVQGYSVDRVDIRTPDISQYTKKADVLVSCTGVPNLITQEMIKPGAMVIDVGSPKGDVDFEKVRKVASIITPVPGGVGPLTIVSLLKNICQNLIK